MRPLRPLRSARHPAATPVGPPASGSDVDPLDLGDCTGKLIWLRRGLILRIKQEAARRDAVRRALTNAEPTTERRAAIREQMRRGDSGVVVEALKMYFAKLDRGGEDGEE